MSEKPVETPKEELTMEEIQSRYNAKCAQLGDLHYRTQVLQQNIQSICVEIADLNRKSIELSSIKDKETAPEVVQ